MESPVLARIDLLLGAINAISKVTEAVELSEASYDFDDERNMMEAVLVDLKAICYPGAREIRDLYAMVLGTIEGVREIPFYGNQGNSPYFQVQNKPWNSVRLELLHWLCKLEQSLKNAYDFCKVAQKQTANTGVPENPIEVICKSEKYKLLLFRERKVLDEILHKGPIKGRNICDATGVNQNNLTDKIIPRLKDEFGVENDGGGRGYYIPEKTLKAFVAKLG